MSHTMPFGNTKQDVEMAEELKINRNKLYLLERHATSKILSNQMHVNLDKLYQKAQEFLCPLFL